MTIARYIGLAEEPVFNQPTPPAAVTHIDIASSTLDAPTDTQMIYGGGLQRSAILHRPGFYAPTGNMVYAFDVRSIGFLLKWALGGYKFTAGTAPAFNVHKFHGTEETILPSFCARVGKDIFEHVFSGCTINSLELTVEGEWCMATADVVAAKDSRATLVPIPNLLLSPAHPLAFYEVTATLAGVAMSHMVKSFTLSIANNASAEAGQGLGSRHPRRIVAGERETTFSKNLYYENIAALERLWGGTTGPVAGGSTEFPVIINVDSGEHGSMTITLPKVIYTQVQQQPTGRDAIVQATAGRAMMDGATEINVEVKNLHGKY